MDGLRGIAALWVVLCHIGVATGQPFGLLSNGAGQIGVMLFFTLSGYLMSHVTHGQAISADRLWTFWGKRLARVVPLFWAVLVLALVLSMVSQTFGAGQLVFFRIDSMTAFLRHVFLIDGNAVLWTIGVELFFYAIFPFFWWLRGASQRLYVAGLLGGSAAGFLLAIFVVPGNLPVFLTLPFYIHFFLIGILLRDWSHLAEPWPRPQLCLAGALLAVLIGLPHVQALLLRHDTNPWADPFLVVAIPVLIGVVKWVPLASKLLTHQAAIYLGTISYSLYLLHFPVLQNTQRLTGWHASAPLLYALVVVGISLAASHFVYRLYEMPARVVITKKWLPVWLGQRGKRTAENLPID